MRTKYYYYVATIALFSLIACKKSQTADPTGSSGTTGTSGTTGITGSTGSTGSTGTVLNTPTPGVYLFGSTSKADDPIFQFGYGTMWLENALPVTLTTIPSEVTSATIQGKDIYTTGDITVITQTAKQSLACFWKNGELFRLTFGVETIASASDISVQGSDIYATVNLYSNFTSSAVYFKNADRLPLTAPGPVVSAYGIVAKGGDLYIAGNYYLNGHNIGCYWKNGAVVASFANDSQASRIAVADNGDVYVIGSDVGPDGKSRANLWKNGVATILPTSKVSAVANGITLDGNDVYVAGTETDATGKISNGVYWKNAVATTVNALSLYAIAVSGNDVYVTGAKPNPLIKGRNYAGCWKNGVLEYGEALPSGYSAVLVVK